MPVIVPDMTNADYHRKPSMSSGGIRRILKTPAHYRAWRAAPPEATPAMQFGTSIHTAVLEPDRWGETIQEIPGDAPDRRSNAGRLWWERFYAAAGSRILLTHEQASRINAIRCAVVNTAAADVYLRGGHVENSLFWHQTARSKTFECRARPDFMTQDFGVVVDLKSAADASKEAFKRALWNYRYDIQAAWYLDGVYACTGVMPHSYLWCVVEPDPPHAVAWYRAEQRPLEIARIDIERGKNTYARCLETGEWPGYPDSIQPIDAPRWAAANVDPEEQDDE